MKPNRNRRGRWHADPVPQGARQNFQCHDVAPSPPLVGDVGEKEVKRLILPKKLHSLNSPPCLALFF